MEAVGSINKGCLQYNIYRHHIFFLFVHSKVMISFYVQVYTLHRPFSTLKYSQALLSNKYRKFTWSSSAFRADGYTSSVLVPVQLLLLPLLCSIEVGTGTIQADHCMRTGKNVGNVRNKCYILVERAGNS